MYRVANLFAPVTGRNYHQRVRVGLLNPAEAPNLLRHFDKQIMGGCTPYRERRRVRHHKEPLLQVARVDQSSSVKLPLEVISTPVKVSHESRDSLLRNPTGRSDLRVLPSVIFHRPLPGLGKEVCRNANQHCSNCSDQQALTHIGSVRKRGAKTSLSLRWRDVGFADCSLHYRQDRRRGSNVDDFKPIGPDNSKASQCLILVAAQIPNRAGINPVRPERISQRDSRFLQITQSDQRSLMPLKGSDVRPVGLQVRLKKRPSGNPAIKTLHLVLPRVMGKSFKGFQVLPFVPLDRPFLGLGKEVGRNANHHCSNCSDQQALTHMLFDVRHEGVAKRPFRNVGMSGPVVRFADRSLNFRQLRRRSNNLEDFGPIYGDNNKASQYIPCVTARQPPGPGCSLWIRTGQRDPRLFQITESDQRVAMVQEVGSKCLRAPREGLRPSGNSTISTFQLVLPCVLGNPFKGFQVLAFVPFDRPLLRL
jgi:hypothetical protein